MLFTIITPSYNQLDDLRRCVASVADQADAGHGAACIEVHHHVQDGGSGDGTQEWLQKYSVENLQRNPGSCLFSFQSEPDHGMYDAINRGVQFAFEGAIDPASGISSPDLHHASLINPRDGVIAWLNCDEQYLPGTLGKAAAYFEQHPAVDILFGGMLVVDPAGQLLSCRKAMPMRRHFLEASYLYNYSCAMFFRRSAWERLGGLDTRYVNAGDEELIRRALKAGFRTAVLGDYLSTFTYGVGNLSSDADSALEEHERLKRSGMAASPLLRVPVNLMRLTEKWLRGGMVERGTVTYDIYTDSMQVRTRFETKEPGCRWPDESKPYLTSHRLK